MIDRPLTLAEARERSRLLRVTSYDVDLDLTRGDAVFGSRVTVRLTCAEEGASSFAELRDGRAVSVTLNGRPLPASAYDGSRIALDGLATDNVLVVDAELPYTSTGDGMQRYVDAADGEVYVGAYVGVVNAQRVFAAFDQPDLKAAITTRVTAPTGWTVVANGRALEGGPASGRWSFATTPRISPYLFVVVAGPLHSVTTEHRGVPFALHCRRSQAAHLDREAEEILAITRACFDRYAEMFHEPYPFDSYDQAFVPELNWGALESAGCVLFRDEYVFESAVTDEQRLTRATTIAHEMAHMWFGNLVTMRWWDDIWLSESFAEYLGSRVVEEATPFSGAWTLFALGRKPWGYDADERRSTHPVAPAESDVLDTAAALENFDGISYAKGASALRQLAAWLGDDVFLAAVDGLLTERAFDAATLHDVLDALERASGRDVHGWAERWLRTSGVDTLRLERVDGAARVVHPGARPHLVSVGLFDLADGDPARPVLRREEHLLLPESPEPVAVPLAEGEALPDLLLLNRGDLSYAKARLDPVSEAVLAEGLSGLEDPLDRTVAWVSWRDRVRDAELAPSDYLSLVARHLPDEDEAAVADTVMGFARTWVADRYLHPGLRDDALASLRATGESLREQAIRSGAAPSLLLAATRWTVECSGPGEASELRAWLEGGVPGGPDLDEDLRWRVLQRLSVLGATDADEIAAALAAAPTEQAVLHAARCRASLPDPDAKRAAWALALEGDAASAYLVRATMEAFWRPEQRAVVAPFVPAYAEAAVAAAGRRGSAVADAVGWRGFPWHEVDDATVRLVQPYVDDPATTEALRRSLADNLDEYRRALSVRAAWPAPPATPARHT